MEYSLSQKLDALRQIAQEKLQAILWSIPDHKKELILDAALIKPLEHVCGATWLRSHGVAKICRFNAAHTPLKRSILVYMIACDLRLFQQVVAQIHSIVTHQPAHAAPELQDLQQFHIIAVPTVLAAMAGIVEAEGLAGFVQLHRFNWDFLALDANLLSLEQPQLYREVFVRGETALLATVAESMRLMHMVFRRPAIMLSYGQHAEQVMRLLQTDCVATDEDSEFGAMIVVDRDRDYASCLLQPVTYSGLLLDVFPAAAGTLLTDAASNRIRTGQLDFLRVPGSSRAAAVPAESQPPPASGHLRLNGTHDTTYRDQRFRHFSEVVQLLGAAAKQIGVERGQLKDMQLGDMQQYVAEKLPKLTAHKKELTRHMALCEVIVKELGGQFEAAQSLQDASLRNESRKGSLARIEEQLAIEAQRTTALRQICLLHLTCGGLSHEEATGFVQNYLNAFGYGALPAFVRLAQAGLFADLEAVPKIAQKLNTLNILKQTPFQTECAKLRQLPAESADDAVSTKSAASTSSATPATPAADRGPAVQATSATCPSYVFNGSYIPLVAQLASALLGSQRYEEFASRVVHTDQLRLWRYAGRSERGQGVHPAELAANIKTGALADLLPLKRRNLWLHVLGGVTMAELAACDLVGRMTGATVVVTSDRVAACDDYLEAICVG